MAKKMRKDAPVVFSYKEVKTLLRYISPVSGQMPYTPSVHST